MRKRRFEAYDTYSVSYTENNWMDSSFFARNFTLTDFNNLVLSGEIQIFCKRENTLDTLVAYGKVSWLFHLISDQRLMNMEN